MPSPPQVQVELATLRSPETRLAVLWAGQKAGLWTYHCLHEGHYVLDIGGAMKVLTAAEVDNLPTETLLADYVTIVDGAMPSK